MHMIAHAINFVTCRLKASVLHKVQAKSLEWFTNILSKHFGTSTCIEVEDQ